MKKTASLFLIILSFFGYSQNYKGQINAVKQTGLHQIVISPEVRAFAKEDLRYFRIVDSKNNQIPYTFLTSKLQIQKYSPFQIISKNSIADSITSIVIKNEKNSELSRLSLQIENTSLSKSYSVSGSNDAKEWFGILENEILSDLVSTTQTSVSKNISFPKNKYSYLRIIFNDKKSLPLNILSVGIAESILIPEKLVSVPNFTYKIVEDKSKKSTRIVFSAPNKFHIDAISFSITTEYYNRNARILAKKTQKTRKKRIISDEVKAAFELNSKHDQLIYIDGFEEKDFTIEIDNFDDKPLAIKNITLFQKPLLILSKLDKKEVYEVLIDTTFSKPLYDLADFITESKSNFPEASISNFENASKNNSKSNEKPFWQTQVFMWICIITGAVTVGYFAFGLLKDMKDN